MDCNILTLGFARRFATYKRPNLLLHDPRRLLRLLSDSQRPVQLIIAGKAHPADAAGQALIQAWIHFIRRSEARHHVVFLSDYDMRLTQELVRGVDVWLNTPRRPWEACGTSGMKVLVNGGINLSELDGWWADAYTQDVGWALRFGEVKVQTDGGQHRFETWVYLDDLEPQAVRIELYADGIDGGTPERVAMEAAEQLVGSVNGYAYRAAVPDIRPASDYTARVIPQHEGVTVPLEAAQILWQR